MKDATHTAVEMALNRFDSQLFQLLAQSCETPYFIGLHKALLVLDEFRASVVVEHRLSSKNGQLCPECEMETDEVEIDGHKRHACTSCTQLRRG